MATTHVAWVSLDRGDIDPARLWTHAIAALAVTEPAVGTASLAALRAHPEEFDSYGLPALLDEIPDEGADVVLMLDDFHLAETAQIIATIGAFLRYRPARVQLVISTRADPGLGIARLAAAGNLVEIRADDVRFDNEGVGLFFAGWASWARRLRSKIAWRNGQRVGPLHFAWPLCSPQPGAGLDGRCADRWREAVGRLPGQ